MNVEYMLNNEGNQNLWFNWLSSLQIEKAKKKKKQKCSIGFCASVFMK